MTTPVQMMLEKYSCKNAQDYKNALEEELKANGFSLSIEKKKKNITVRCSRCF